jgi:hypothetical protein
MSGVQFLAAMETVRVLPWGLPQLPQRSFRSKVEQSRVRRPAVLQRPSVDVGPLSAGRTGRDDHMPGAQISRVTLAAHETPLSH